MRMAGKSAALVSIFAALYAVLSFLPLFGVIGAGGRFISMAVILAPLAGITLGPWLGVVAITIGGAISASIQTGPFGPLSFVPSSATALCSGLLYLRKRWIAAISYSGLLSLLTFYPVVGPAWLYPHFVWFHLVGLIVLTSPLQSEAISCLHGNPSLWQRNFGITIISLTSTLFGHIVGNLMFEVMYWPLLVGEVGSWRLNWQLLTVIYPVERVIITLLATLIGAPITMALRVHGTRFGGTAHATRRDSHSTDQA